VVTAQDPLPSRAAQTDQQGRVAPGVGADRPQLPRRVWRSSPAGQLTHDRLDRRVDQHSSLWNRRSSCSPSRRPAAATAVLG